MPWPAAGTELDFLSNFRDVEPSFLVRPCLTGFIFGELRSRAYIATCMGTIAMFSMKDAFVDGSFDVALILRGSFRDHIF